MPWRGEIPKRPGVLIAGQVSRQTALTIVLVGVVVGGLALSHLASRGTADGPCLSLEALEYDMGEVAHDQWKTVVIKFKNTGNKTLHIWEVGTGCNCMAATIEGRDYPPSAEGHIEVRYRAMGSPLYPIRERVHIVSNDTSEPIKTITLVGRMVSHVAVIPERIDFGNIPIGGRGQASVIVAVLGLNERFEIRSARTDVKGAVLTVDAANSADVPPGFLDKAQAYKVRIRTPQLLRKGGIRGSVQIEITGKLARTLVVPVSGNVVSRLSYEPRFLLLLADTVSPSSTRLLRIHAPTAKGVRVENAPDSVACLAKGREGVSTWVFECQCKKAGLGFEKGQITFEIEGHPYEKYLSVPYAITAPDGREN